MENAITIIGYNRHLDEVVETFTLEEVNNAKEHADSWDEYSHGSMWSYEDCWVNRLSSIDVSKIYWVYEQ